jgi:hypothetical protein
MILAPQSSSSSSFVVLHELNLVLRTVCLSIVISSPKKWGRGAGGDGAADASPRQCGSPMATSPQLHRQAASLPARRRRRRRASTRRDFKRGPACDYQSSASLVHNRAQFGVSHRECFGVWLVCRFRRLGASTFPAFAFHVFAFLDFASAFGGGWEGRGPVGVGWWEWPFPQPRYPGREQL